MYDFFRVSHLAGRNSRGSGVSILVWALLGLIHNPKGLTMTKIAKTLSHVYLYGDSHAVEVHEEWIAKAGKTVTWVEIFETWGPKVSLPASDQNLSEAGKQYGQGRILLTVRHARGLAALIRKAEGISATIPSVEQGSSKTKEIGIVISHFEIRTKDGPISLETFPGLLSSDILYQPEDEHTATFAGHSQLSEWGFGGYRVHKIHKRAE